MEIENFDLATTMNNPNSAILEHERISDNTK